MFKIITKKKYEELVDDNSQLTMRLLYAEHKLGYVVTQYDAYGFMVEKMSDNLSKQIDTDIRSIFN